MPTATHHSAQLVRVPRSGQTRMNNAYVEILGAGC